METNENKQLQHASFWSSTGREPERLNIVSANRTLDEIASRLERIEHRLDSLGRLVNLIYDNTVPKLRDFDDTF